VRAAKLAAAPVAAKRLGKVTSRPAVSNPNPNADVIVTVKRGAAATLKRIVAKAKLPKPVARRVRWQKAGAGKVSLRIVGASTFSRREHGDPSTKGAELWVYDDLELRPRWAWRIIRGMVTERLHTVEHRI
jgi:hypothetical protein